MEVIKRTDGNYDDVCNRITDAIVSLKNMNTDARARVNAAAKATAAKATWQDFITDYVQAYDSAVKKAGNRLNIK